MGTQPDKLARTGAKRVATNGTADTPPTGKGADALADWLDTSGTDLDNNIIETAAELAFNSGAIESSSTARNSDWNLLQSGDQKRYIRESLTGGGPAQGSLDSIARITGLDNQTSTLARTALTPVANQERFYWQTAYTNAQVTPRPIAARRALLALRKAERDETNPDTQRRIRGVANRISQVYGLEGKVGAVGFASGGRGKAGTDIVTTPRLQKWNRDTVES